MINIAFSPCPNDTFIFHALVHGKVEDAPDVNVTYADIDKTNYWAQDLAGPEVMKISFAALPYVIDDYTLIPCGGALGRGVGPLVLTKEKETPAYLEGKKIAVPSDRSTAYLLFRLWTEQKLSGEIGEIIVMPFEEIMPAVRDGKVDAGLVIHEARFTYETYGLSMLEDLGDWWEKDTGFPIPLGAIIARRGAVDKEKLTGWIRQSVDAAWLNPSAASDYIAAHAQEMSPEVQQSHIDLYVNEFSRNLGEDGFSAVESLLGRAMKADLVPRFDLQKLYD
ncbi:1,4-dihydroxy-6-naphthoate synthase [Salisediminibacterium halotolerans]|nr:1,4-dihydroxy-6-naphthoate synthase [Actinophytocola xinjiangensis]RPE86659.1 1,4-dihydroxy-6-naphthoate synthase [Salisediminibacterium halotolerans]TWG34034.1 1,4-dihydroxy-6-naphthoate synthase [Salisediminibacterium halotolerans]GEL08309.1 1,4-dihydroxy-6-naphtoate synthase [Salisediminibacterium halotolerans]